MKWLKNIKENSIIFLIYAILLMIVTNGVLDYYYRKTLEKHEATAKEVQDVKNHMTHLLNTLQNMDVGFRGYYIVPKEQLLSPFIQAKGQLGENMKNIERIMHAQGLPVEEFKPVKDAFYEYALLIDQLVQWRDEERLSDIENVINDDPGLDLWLVYDAFNQKFQAKQNEILAKSERIISRAMTISSLVRLSMLVFGIPTLIIVAIRLNRAQRRRKELFISLDESNKKYLFNSNEDQDDDRVDEQEIIKSLIANLQKAAEFISNIAKGNYEIQWAGLNEKNKKDNEENLVGELLKMRDQMVNVRQEDQKRMWVTEGISLFSEIVRQHQDNMEMLSDTLTSQIAKYLKANQVYLYFVSDEDEELVLELFGCYAYDKKRYVEKTIAPGQGLVGQTYLEKSTNYLTKIPPNYVNITSGLGEATPNCLVIVPLKFNDIVEGILEIASFKPFQQHEIEFLERIGEIIASAIINIRGAVKMKKMMETMQVQSEEMRAQEEEMRQNMEELQATQEEMSRKAQEYQGLLEEKESMIEKYVEEINSLKESKAL